MLFVLGVSFCPMRCEKSFKSASVANRTMIVAKGFFSSCTNSGIPFHSLRQSCSGSSLSNSRGSSFMVHLDGVA